MARFKEVKGLDHPALEQEVLAWWTTHQIFPKSVAQREGAPAFTFYEGPPTANGRPGIHHVMARTIKDTFCRYKTMKGFQVERKAGWDTHGLPVEIEVEKELGLEGRGQVEAYGIEKYNAACRESVLRYKDLWDQLTVRMGYWVDLDDPYITFKNEYIESVWWLLKQIYDKGLLYKGYKIQWYSPGTGTVLSSHEVSLGYEEVQDPSVYVRFPLEGADNVFFLAWTTTPWTLISNTALAVGPDIDYVKIRLTGENARHDEEYFILARDRLSVIRENYEVVETCKGRDLVGLTYTPLFSYFTDEVRKGEAWRVVAADFVSTEDGTGVVHLAPAFGADDYAVGQAEGLPLFNPITADGTFVDRIDLVAGEWFKDADKKITRNLFERGLLYRHETYLHNYPHDWRKGTPLMSYPVESWFIRTTAIKDRLIALNEQINWQPATIGTGRFGEWLKNNIDWALSRRRYWGTPLPIWVSDRDPDYVECVGSIEELRQKPNVRFPEGELDLHRPFVDQITWDAPGGGTMRRVPDLIDVWFDSGAMPFAQWHYPFENRERFARNFPADFIAEGVDQTRGWFYTLHAIAALVMDERAYKNVVVNGLVLDEAGNKMSKSKGNAVDPFETIGRHGADVVRWYMMSNTPPWENLKFSERGLQDTARKFFSTLANVYSFFATYANIDGFRYDGPRIPVAEREELDRWIMSRLNTTIAEVDAALEGYNPTRAARAIEAFVEEFSNWYIRRSRRRFWSAKEANGAASAAGKQAAYQTVYEALLAVAGLMSPIAPFFGEWLYQALIEGRDGLAESVHLADFPAVEAVAIDADLERRMGLARTISSVVLGLRNQAGINVRQPLPRILVVTGPQVAREDVERVGGIILDEVNVKAIEYVATSSDVVKRTARPNYKNLGKRLGRLMKPTAEAIRTLSDEQIEHYLTEGRLTLTVEGQELTFSGDDIEVLSEGIEGWLVGQEDGVTVALDTTLTPDLVAEGLARESVNRVQNLRKKAHFDLTDRIAVQYHATEALRQAFQTHADWIRNETLALELQDTEQPAGDVVETFQIGNEELTVGVRRVEA
ncbi:MAG: isoleucine--tRNA ligase [Bacteroidetes bacterium]|nr:isoleucine--tRNA ligase [Rhodothermaceae bacterium RA]RMH67156.1 MAG: isoleucine--tRNA ligase [Bacteroidota bacterium]